jgi:hypothetical protein
MPRKPERKSQEAPAIRSKKQELEAREAAIKARLSQTKEFLEKAPTLKAEAQRKQQQEVLNRFNRPVRIEGPVDFQLEFVSSKGKRPPRKLRRERTRTPWVTMVLLVVFAVVIYFSWRAM